MTKPTVYIAGYDLHFPKHSEPTFSCMLNVIKDIKPSGYIFGGDQLDNSEISHHNAKKPLYKPQGAYKRNTQRFDEEILSPIERALPRGTEKIWIIGNHCDWERQFIEAHPEFEGWIERPTALRLAQRGWEVIPIGYAKRVGHLNIIHGEVLTGVGNQAGMYPSRKAVELYGDNVLAGHTHAPQSFAKISPVDQKRKHMAWIAPILGATNPDYLVNRPTAWLNGFVVIEFYGGGMFNLYPVIVFNGQCSYGGKVYSANSK